MIDLNTINRSNFASDIDYLKSIAIIVDANWEEVKEPVDGETAIEYFNRFKIFESSDQFSYMIAKRIYETDISESNARNSDIRAHQNKLDYGVCDHYLNQVISNDKKLSLQDHYQNLLHFESLPYVKNVINKRDGENEEDFRKRFINYRDTKKSLEENVDNEILELLARVNDEQSLEEWKNEAQKAYEENLPFITTPRRITSENNRLETALEVSKRAQIFYNVLHEIDCLILGEKHEEELNNPLKKEIAKIEAKRIAEKREEERQEEERQADKLERIEDVKPVLFISVLLMFSLIGTMTLIQNSGWDNTIELYFKYGPMMFGIVGFVIFILFIMKKLHWLTKLFKFLCNMLFWICKILIFVLNSLGMSVTNKKEI